MSNFIDARVIQKTGSEAEWLANDLILYKGELALVTQGDRVVNIKVGNGTKKFSELPYIYSGGFEDSVTPTTQGSTLVDGMYIANGAGTYTNMGRLVVKDGYFTIISKVGTTYKIASEVKMPAPDLTPIENRITEVESSNTQFQNNVNQRIDDLETEQQDFIENFSVEVDQEFDERSENAIANKEVSKLADALEGFKITENEDEIILSFNYNSTSINGVFPIKDKALGDNNTIIETSGNADNLVFLNIPLVFNNVKQNRLDISFQRLSLNQLNRPTLVGIKNDNNVSVLVNGNSSSVSNLIEHVNDIDLSNYKSVSLCIRGSQLSKDNFKITFRSKNTGYKDVKNYIDSKLNIENNSIYNIITTEIDNSLGVDRNNVSINNANNSEPGLSNSSGNITTVYKVPNNVFVRISTTNNTSINKRYLLSKNANLPTGTPAWSDYNLSTDNLYESFLLYTSDYDYLYILTKTSSSESYKSNLKIEVINQNSVMPKSINRFNINTEITDISDFHRTSDLIGWNILGNTITLKSVLNSKTKLPYEERLDSILGSDVKMKSENYRFYHRPYHNNIFSIKLKYPNVTLSEGDLYNSNGTLNLNANKVTVVNEVPAQYVGCTLSFSKLNGLIIKSSSNAIIYQKNISGYNSVDSWITAIKEDLPNDFEINIDNQYLDSFDKIYEFENIAMTKSIPHCNIKGEFTSGGFIDSYPVYIKTNSIGQKHNIEISIETNGNAITNSRISFDGVIFQENLLKDRLISNKNVTCSLKSEVVDYKKIPVPFVMITHYLQKSDTEKYGVSLKGTTARFKRIFEYLKQNNFTSLNMFEAYDMMERGTLPNRSFVLTTDEINIDWWVDEEKRNMFLNYNVKPTFVVNPDYTQNIDINGSNQQQFPYFTNEAIKQAEQQGWRFVIHPSATAIANLSYAQFVKLLNDQQKWLDSKGVSKSRFVLWHVGNTLNHQDSLCYTLGLTTRFTTSEGLPCGNNLKGNHAIRRRYVDETANAQGTTGGGMTFNDFITLADKYL